MDVEVELYVLVFEGLRVEDRVLWIRQDQYQ